MKTRLLMFACIATLFLTYVGCTPQTKNQNITDGTFNSSNESLVKNLAEPAQVEVVEYYSSSLQHYFLTAHSFEEEVLDSGKISGWVRTGYSFKAYANAGQGLNEVCRYYGNLANGGPDTHFYSAYPNECAILSGNPLWTFEEIAFYITQPINAAACPSGTAVINRMYNNGHGGVANHRYVVDPAQIPIMQSRGWLLEGPVFCSPIATPTSTTTPPPAPPTNGMCGAAAGKVTSSFPTSDLCVSGTPSPATLSGTNFIWKCYGSGSGLTADCSAPQLIISSPPGSIDLSACSAAGYIGHGVDIAYPLSTNSPRVFTAPQGSSHGVGNFGTNDMIVVRFVAPASELSVGSVIVASEYSIYPAAQRLATLSTRPCAIATGPGAFPAQGILASSLSQAPNFNMALVGTGNASQIKLTPGTIYYVNYINRTNYNGSDSCGEGTNCAMYIDFNN